MTYVELQAALSVLGLSKRAGLKEIKAKHRDLVKRYHPDTGSGNPDKIREVNAAYRVIAEYVGSYSFSFAEEEFYEQNPEERLMRQFMDDPLWGKG